MRAKFDVIEQTQGLHLQAKFHLNVFIESLCWLPVAKKQFWAYFDIFGGSCTNPLLPMRAKFGVLQQTHGVRLHAKFYLNVYGFRRTKSTFWANFDIFGGSCTDPLLPMRAKFGVLEQPQGLHLQALSLIHI